MFWCYFNIIVLLRKGVNSFISKVLFFSFIFTLCLFIAKLVYLVIC
ncbi:MAG: WzyE family oligosaccharide polymerase [Arsenophonus sp. NEOnobi-MAG3]